MRTAAAETTLTLQLVDRVGLPRDAQNEMMRETVELWRAAGVEVKWSMFRAASAVTDSSSPAHVTVVVRPDVPDELRTAPVGVEVMASILFVNNRPTQLIAAYPAQVQRLLETMRLDVRPISERPAALRQRMMGRVLGRAIAHELGHYLFGSSDHTADGLMRARHRLDELTSPFRRAFRVMPALPLACDGLTVARGSSPLR